MVKTGIRKPIYLDENCTIKEAVEKTDCDPAIITSKYIVGHIFFCLGLL